MLFSQEKTDTDPNMKLLLFTERTHKLYVCVLPTVHQSEFDYNQSEGIRTNDFELHFRILHKNSHLLFKKILQ